MIEPAYERQLGAGKIARFRQTFTIFRAHLSENYDRLIGNGSMRYLIPVLSKALDVLDLLQKAKGPITSRTIRQRTGISQTTIYRILKTFVRRGYVVQSQDGLYRLAAHGRDALLDVVTIRKQGSE